MARHVDEAWRTYLKAVTRPDMVMGWGQIQEMRRCFYAGVSAMYAVMVQLGEDMPEEDGVAIMGGIRAELEDFVKRVTRGQA